MSNAEGENGDYFRDLDDGGETLDEWCERLGQYLDERRIVEPGRRARMPAPPWPAKDNVVLGYLLDRARELVAKGELEQDGAFLWLAVHAWFEGALDERYRNVSHLTEHT